MSSVPIEQRKGRAPLRFAATGRLKPVSASGFVTPRCSLQCVSASGRGDCERLGTGLAEPSHLAAARTKCDFRRFSLRSKRRPAARWKSLVRRLSAAGLNTYGKAATIREIIELSETTYREAEYCQVVPHFAEDIDGIHHMHSSGAVTVRRDYLSHGITLRPGDTVVDIGANIGAFTVLAAKIVGSSGCVIAFEPILQAFERLRENVALNAFKNVECRRAAVDAQEGTSPCAFPRSPPSHRPISRARTSPRSSPASRWSRCAGMRASGGSICSKSIARAVSTRSSSDYRPNWPRGSTRS